MKQSIFRIICLVTLGFMLSAPMAHAQFFKKLGKALEKVDKAADKLLSTPNTQQTPSKAQPKTNAASTTQTADGVSISCKIPGVKVTYQGVTIEEGQQVITFLLTNTTNKIVKIHKFEDVKNFDLEGNEAYSRTMFGKQLTSLGNGIFDLEPGIPVKCKIWMIETPLSVKGLAPAQIRTLINDSGWKDAFIEFRNVDFTQAKVVSGPFVGDFKIDKYGAAELNLYKPTVEAYDAEAVGSKTCYGTLYMDVCGDGSRTETSDIVRAQISTDGCYAKIDYIGGRDGCLYRMVLHYDTTWKNLKVESVDLIDDKDNEHPESYFGVGQVFKRKL